MSAFKRIKPHQDPFIRVGATIPQTDADTDIDTLNLEHPSFCFGV